MSRSFWSSASIRSRSSCFLLSCTGTQHTGGVYTTDIYTAALYTTALYIRHFYTAALYTTDIYTAAFTLQTFTLQPFTLDIYLQPFITDINAAALNTTDIYTTAWAWLKLGCWIYTCNLNQSWAGSLTSWSLHASQDWQMQVQHPTLFESVMTKCVGRANTLPGTAGIGKNPTTVTI